MQPLDIQDADADRNLADYVRPMPPLHKQGLFIFMHLSGSQHGRIQAKLYNFTNLLITVREVIDDIKQW